MNEWISGIPRARPMPGKDPAHEESEPNRKAWVGWQSCDQTRVIQQGKLRNGLQSSCPLLLEAGYVQACCI